jgi:hypothetical protein
MSAADIAHALGDARRPRLALSLPAAPGSEPHAPGWRRRVRVGDMLGRLQPSGRAC